VSSTDLGRARLALVVLVVGVLVAGACGGDAGSAAGGGGGGNGGGGGTSEESPSGETIAIAGKDASDHGTKDVSGSDEVKMEMDDFYFAPTVLRGDAGSSVTLELDNEGNADHNFSVTEQGIDQDVAAGEDAKVKVRFPETGTLLFLCKFHTSQGMNGGLEAK
jgi:plastocyanin